MNPNFINTLKEISVNEKDEYKVKKTEKLIEKISKLISTTCEDIVGHPITHYSNKGFIPPWVVIPEMYLGDTIMLLEILPDTIQKAITNHFKIFLIQEKNKSIKIDYPTLISILRNMREFRNIIAHNNRLLKHKCQKNIRYISGVHDAFGIDKNDDRQGWYHFMISIQVFFPKVERDIITRTISESCDYMQLIQPDINWNTIFRSLGIKINS